MKSRVVVAKVGGSLARRGFESLKLTLDELGSLDEAVVVVPGGWVFADISRLVDSCLNLKAGLSHSMGILAMEMYGYIVANFGFSAATLEDLREVKKGDKLVLLPYSSGLHESELPKSWRVTSDSIAVWVAQKLREWGYDAVVLKITDVDGIFKDGHLLDRVKAEDVRGCVDSYALKLIRKYGIRLFVCNGIRRGRVKGYIVEGRTLGTLIE